MRLYKIIYYLCIIINQLKQFYYELRNEKQSKRNLGKQ
jgi:hypothetical protein